MSLNILDGACQKLPKSVVRYGTVALPKEQSINYVVALQIKPLSALIDFRLVSGSKMVNDNPEVIDPALTSRADIAKDQWANTIRVQIHFNEIIQRTRQLTATVVVGAYGSAAAFFASNPTTYVMVYGNAIHVTTPLVLIGMLFLLVGLVNDKFYYFSMLLRSVEEATKYEKNDDLPIKLATALSEAVNKHLASAIVYLFYAIAFAVGLALIWFTNKLVVFDGRDLFGLS